MDDRRGGRAEKEKDNNSIYFELYVKQIQIEVEERFGAKLSF